MASVNSDAQTWIRAYQISRTQNFRSEGRRRQRPRSRWGPCPLRPHLYEWGLDLEVVHQTHSRLRSSDWEQRGAQGARSSIEGASASEADGNVNCTAIRCEAGITRLHKDYEQLKVGRSFLDPLRSARGAGRLDAVYRPSERLRDFVDHVPHMRH